MNMTTMMLTRPASAMMPEELDFHMPPWPCTREEGMRRRRLEELQGRALDAVAEAMGTAENPLGFDYDDDGEDDTDLDDDDDDDDFDDEDDDDGGDFDERLAEERPWWG